MNNAMREPVAYLLPDGNGLKLSRNRPREQLTNESGKLEMTMPGKLDLEDLLDELDPA